MRRYRVLLPLTVHTEDGSYTQGEEFDKEFTPEDELTNVESGLLEIVPSTYRVLTDTRVYETAKGDTFTAALLQENEAALIGGGHIERVVSTPKPKKEVKK